MKSQQVSNDPPREGSRRKTFSKPHVQVYGDLKGLTQSAVGMNGDDGATQGNSKTS
jgi:hypothetical protein